MMQLRDEVGTREGRFNVLLTEDRPQPVEHWTRQLPRLLEPQGVASFVAQSGREAMDLVQRVRIHAAIIDMATPLGDPSLDARRATADEPAGVWLMELFRRLPQRLPVVIVHSPAYSERHLSRLLQQALRLGAFSVLNEPVDLEQLLRVFQRLLEREYRGIWPGH